MQQLMMFTTTNEDMPLFSHGQGQEEAIAQAEYSHNGLDGYYNGCNIHIWITKFGQYRLEVHGTNLFHFTTTEFSLEAAQKAAENAARTHTRKV